MAVSEVVKNIYTFANIVSQAHLNIVQHWDLHSLNNALNWAKYCMKVEIETRNKQYRSDLDKYIQSLTILLDPVSLLQLDINKLQNATGILCKVLLQNPRTPNSLLNTIHTVSTEVSLQVEIETRSVTSCGDTLYQLVGEDVSFSYKSHEDQAEHIMERLVHLKNICTSSSHRYDRFLEKFLLKLKNHKNGWYVALYMLLTEIEREEDYFCVTGIKEKMLNSFQVEAMKTECGLWQCDSQLLCEVASQDDCFCATYMQYLSSWANKMQPEYGVMTNGQLYQWRYCLEDPGDSHTYNLLVEHINTALAYSKRLKLKVEKLITGNAEQSFFNVWKDIWKLLKL